MNRSIKETLIKIPDNAIANINPYMTEILYNLRRSRFSMKLMPRANECSNVLTACTMPDRNSKAFPSNRVIFCTSPSML